MKKFSDTIRYLYSLQKYGIKLGLHNIQALMTFLDNPHINYPIIHIAGTNGKGSTAAMLAAILKASGYKTALYTSPHLVKFNERIRINGDSIPDKDIIHYTKKLLPVINKLNATFFEATTAIAFKYFSDKKVDVAIVETGLGGRLDSTNVVKPILSIITTIDYDHMDQLGNTLGKIAFEKAGIIKEGIPCITSVENIEALSVLRRTAFKNKSVLVESKKVSSIKQLSSSIFSQKIDFKFGKKYLKNIEVELPGKYQLENIQLVLTAINYLNSSKRKRITPYSIKNGLKNIRKFTGFRGRLEVISKKPLIIADVAHNEQAFTKLIDTLYQFGIHSPVLLFGVMKDKNVDKIVKSMQNSVKLIVGCAPEIDRAMNSKNIVRICKRYNIPAIDGINIGGGINKIRKYAGDNDVIVICGSHYVLGEIYQKYFPRA